MHLIVTLNFLLKLTLLCDISISFHFEDSNHIHVWRNNEKYIDKLFVDQFNFNEEPLHAISATSCGRLCTNLGISPAFSYRRKNCYCYASTPNSNSSYTNMRGAVYYTKEPVEKSIGN